MKDQPNPFPALPSDTFGASLPTKQPKDQPNKNEQPKTIIQPTNPPKTQTKVNKHPPHQIFRPSFLYTPPHPTLPHSPPAPAPAHPTLPRPTPGNPSRGAAEGQRAGGLQRLALRGAAGDLRLPGTQSERCDRSAPRDAPRDAPRGRKNRRKARERQRGAGKTNESRGLDIRKKENGEGFRCPKSKPRRSKLKPTATRFPIFPFVLVITLWPFELT